jgi:hypothetical protein
LDKHVTLDVLLTNISQQWQANSAYCHNDSITTDQLAFLHAALFSPVTSTLLHVIRQGHLTTWPAASQSAMWNIFLHKSVATVKGPLDQAWKNQQLTKTTATDEEDMTALPSPPITDWKSTHFIYAAIISAPTSTRQIYTDQTGCFPEVLQCSNKYILMVLYDYDSNSILAEPIKNGTDAEIVWVYESHIDCLTTAGRKPQLQQLNNEASNALEKHIHKNMIDYQLVPPHVHCANVAKRAIQTFKNHSLLDYAVQTNCFHWTRGTNSYHRPKQL